MPSRQHRLQPTDWTHTKWQSQLRPRSHHHMVVESDPWLHLNSAVFVRKAYIIFSIAEYSTTISIAWRVSTAEHIVFPKRHRIGHLMHSAHWGNHVRSCNRSYALNLVCLVPLSLHAQELNSSPAVVIASSSTACVPLQTCA